MADAQGRDQEAPTKTMKVQYHVEVTRTVCVVADDEAQAVERANERLGHLLIEEGAEFPGYCGYKVTGAESVPVADVADGQSMEPDYGEGVSGSQE